MIVLGIIAVMSAVAIPHLSESTEKETVHRSLRNIQSAIALARSHSIVHSKRSYLVQQGDLWQVIDGDHHLLWQMNLPGLVWQGFQGPPLKFDPKGFVTNGSFWACHGLKARPKGLIVSSAGRVRRSQDSDRDGRHDRPNGTAFVCP